MSGLKPASALALASACLLLSSCGDGRGPSPDSKPNIVVFVTDTLRADALAVYGNSAVASPSLTKLAERGVVYERATSSSPWTRPAVASILSGLYPDVHGVQSREDALPEDIALLPELLRGAGYATAAITANPNVGSFFGFDRGFDRYIELYQRKRAGYVRSGELVATAADAVEAALEWIAGADRPFFLFVLTIDPHVPYAPPERFDRYAEEYAGPVRGTNRWLRDKELDEAGRQRLRSLYWGEVTFNDASLASLLEGLSDFGLDESTIVVFTADHGEEFWEHGGWGARQDAVRRDPARAAGRGRPAGRVAITGVEVARQSSWSICFPPCSIGRGSSCPTESTAGCFEANPRQSGRRGRFPRTRGERCWL